MFRLGTPRLVLRDLTEDDEDAIERMSREPAVTRYQFWLRLDSREEVVRWVRDAIHHNGLDPREAYNLAIDERGGEPAIGWIGWGRPEEPAWGDESFGYALLPEYWGRGYMTEALRAALRFMFEELGARRVSACCQTTNQASARVMEKSGMSPVERWTEVEESGEAVEYVRYSIVR